MKKILISILFLAVLTLGLTACGGNELEFKIGKIDETGSYQESNHALYTELIECRGLKVAIDFESKVDFQIFYYDADKVFLECTEVLTNDYNKDCPYATYCRIMLLPKENHHINFNDYADKISDYTSDVDISVSEAQYCDYEENLCKIGEAIDIRSVNNLIVGIPAGVDGARIVYCDENGDKIAASILPGGPQSGYGWTEVTKPYGATHLVYNGAEGVKIYKNDTKSLHFDIFTRGVIDQKGDFKEKITGNVTTKDMFECQGLTVSVKPTSEVEYVIYWYNADGLYFGNTGTLTADFNAANVHRLARYARIAVIGDLGDIVLGNSSVHDVAIEVNRNQNFKPTDLYEIAKAGTAPEGTLPNLNDKYMFYENMHVFGISNGVVLYDFDEADKKEIQEYNVIKLDCSNVKDYSIVFKEDVSEQYYFWFYDSKGTALYLDNGSFARCYGKADAELRLSVPENSRYLFINLPPSDNGESLPVIINEYLPRNEITEALYSNSN